MRHSASKRFWQCLDALPDHVQALAHKNFALLKRSPDHPSLHFKQVGNGRFSSVRVGISHRALGIPVDDGVFWIWIGSHAEYDRLIA